MFLLTHVKCAYMEYIYIHTRLCINICTCSTYKMCIYIYILHCVYTHVHVTHRMCIYGTYMHIHIVQCQYAHLFEGALGLVELIAREDSGLV